MILDEIAAKRKIQLEREKGSVPLETVKRMAEQSPAPKDFAAALRQDRLSVIAEVKKASPSKGLICPDFHPVEIAKAYRAAGADALSVLTEEAYFQGSSEYLKAIRREVNLPILRKDFVIDPYQIYEARAIGADAVLLIAALLDGKTLREFCGLARSLGLACLMEAHSEEELDRVVGAGGTLIGINNRNLKTFRVDLNTTARLAAKIPAGCTLVAESGIQGHADMRTVRETGADAVLIGETLMRSTDAGATLRKLRDGL